MSGEIQLASFNANFHLARLNNHLTSNRDVLEKDQELFMSSVFDQQQDSNSDLIEENSSDQTPSPPTQSTSIADYSSCNAFTTGSSLVDHFIMFEQNAKNNKDVIKECHNAFLEKYLEKNRIGRKSKFQSAIKCKASGSPGYTSRSYTSEKMSKAKLSKSLDATSRSYSSSLSSNLIACALNEDVGETSLSNFDILNSDQTGVDNKNTMSAVSNKPIITDKLAMVINNSLSQQCYSLNLNSLNFHDEASYSSNSIHNGASFRHTSSFSEYYTPTSHGSLTASYVDHQRQNFNQLDTLNENVVDNSNFNNNINYSYVNRVNTDSYANSSGTRMNNILSNSNGHNYGYAANLNEDKYLMARNDVEGWQSGSNMRQHNQHLNEEELKSFNYETENQYGVFLENMESYEEIPSGY